MSTLAEDTSVIKAREKKANISLCLREAKQKKIAITYI
jgi:hypothetical protein